MQLNKYLAQAGVASRRNAVELIKKGSVRINNTVIKDPSHRVLKADVVTVNGKRVIAQEPLYILLNKPAGYITTTADEKGRDTVMDLLGKSFKQRLYPVGRLDRNTTGLLLLTNDGEVAQRLAHPKYEVKKIYQVVLHKPFTETDRNRIAKGIKLEDGFVSVDRISYGLGPKKNQVRITLHSGKNRIVRRIFEEVGYQVKKLDRIALASLSKKGIARGDWRKLRKKEVDQLLKLLGSKDA